MSARFEVVRTDAGWHSRFVAGNNKTVWTTEVYTRRRAAVSAIESLLDQTITTSPFADHPEIARGPFRLTTEVRDIDERYVPPPVVLDPPFYVRDVREFTGHGRATTSAWVEFWHDSEHHSRNCYGDECTQDTPPIGTQVRGRMGTATFTGSAS